MLWNVSLSLLSWPTRVPLKQTKITIHGSSVSIYSLLLSRFTETLTHKLRGPIDSHVESLCTPVAWKGGSLTKHYTLHCYQTKTFFVLNAERFFFTPFFVLHFERLTGLGLASVSHTLASKEDSEKIIQPTINLKKNGGATEGTDYALASMVQSLATWPAFPQL